MAEEDDLLADDLNLDYEVDELLEEDLLGDDDEFDLSGEETFPDQSDTCKRKPISTEEEDILDIGGIDTNLEIEGDEEDKTGIGVTECDSVARENDEVIESGEGSVSRLRDRFKNERPKHAGHKPIIFDCNENKNNIMQQRHAAMNQNPRYKSRGIMGHRGGFQGRTRGGVFNSRQQFSHNQKNRGNFNYIPNRANPQRTYINPWESQGPDLNFNQANQESKKVLINPHFRGNVQPHSDARLIWDPNVGQQNPPPLIIDQYNNSPSQFNRPSQFNSNQQMGVNQFPQIWNEQNPVLNNTILDNQVNLSVPMVTFSNGVQQMDGSMNQPVMEDHNMPMFTNNQQNIPNQSMPQCGYNTQNDLYNSESTENFDDNVTYNIQPQQCFKIPTQSGFRGRGHHRGGVRFTQADNMIIVRPISNSNVVSNNFDGSNNFPTRGNYNNVRPLGFEAPNRIVAPDQMYQQNQLPVTPQSIIPTYGNSQYQNIQPFQQNLSNTNNFTNQCGEFQPNFEQNYNNQTQQNFVQSYNNQLPNQNFNVVNMVSNSDSHPPVYQDNSNVHMRKVLTWNQMSNVNQHNKTMHYVQQNRTFNQKNNFSSNKNFAQKKNFNPQRSSTRQVGIKRVQQKQYTEVGSSNEPVAKKKKLHEFRNLHEVQTVDVPDTTVINDHVQEEDEDEETKAYRLKIEEQKRKREEYMRMKEERRKKAASMGGILDNHKYSVNDSIKLDLKLDRTTSMNVKTTSSLQKKQNLSNLKGSLKPSNSNVTVNRQNVKVIQTVPIRNQNVINKTNFVNSSNFSRPNSAKVRTVLKSNQGTRAVPKEVAPVSPSSISMTVSSSENKSLIVQRVVRQVNPEIDSTESEVINKEHLTSFLSRRVVVPKSLPADSNGVVSTGQNVLLKTPVVKISNLAASTTEMKLRSMCKGVGLVQSVQMLPDTQQAMIKFKNIASAHNFFKKYQRKIVDLSLIDVKLVNVP